MSRLQERVLALQHLHNEYSALERVTEERIRALRRALDEASAPLRERRRLLVTGEVDPSEREVSAPDEDDVDVLSLIHI